MSPKDCLTSVLDLLPDGLLVVLLPVGAGQGDGPPCPRPGRPGGSGPDPDTGNHAGRELYRLVQGGRRHAPMSRRVARPD